jgi:hypothetical protein
MNFFDHKDLGNHLLQLCPKVVKHPVFEPHKDNATSAQLIYVLTRESLLIEDLRYKLLLLSTNAANKLIIQRRKENEIWFKFYSTEAVINREWTKLNYDLRHVVTLMAVQGFHHKIFQMKGYHSPNENCRCKVCDSDFMRYHMIDCKPRTKSLSFHADEN